MAALTESEWLAELERLAAASRERHDAGLTVAEWANRMGFGLFKMRALLNLAKQKGMLVPGSRAIERLDGQAATVPVYAVVRAKEE